MGLWFPSDSAWEDSNTTISTARVVWVRYRFYTVILLLLIFVIWYSYLLPSYENTKIKKIELSNVELQLSSFQTKRVKYESNIWLVIPLNVEPQVIECVNTLKWCKELPDIVKNNFSVVRSYLLLTEMSNNKMSLDEKDFSKHWLILVKKGFNQCEFQYKQLNFKQNNYMRKRKI